MNRVLKRRRKFKDMLNQDDEKKHSSFVSAKDLCSLDNAEYIGLLCLKSKNNKKAHVLIKCAQQKEDLCAPFGLGIKMADWPCLKEEIMPSSR